MSSISVQSQGQRFFKFFTAAVFAAMLAEGSAIANVEDRPASVSSTAERIVSASAPRLLQIRTLVADAGRPSSLGSGFVVTSDGLAVTNYHVVSQAALQPDAFKLEFIAADGAKGSVKLLAIDIANDLAVVRIDKRDLPVFTFSDAPDGGLIKGERLYSLGNPLDLGFTIVEGTYNGRVERAYNERIHFTGAINPGMSGGPTVNAEGQVVGINVAKSYGGELLSFLVPARFASALVKTAKDQGNAPTDFKAVIGRQLAARQAGLYEAFGKIGFRSTKFGPYIAPEVAADWFTCWGQTNAGMKPAPRASVNSINCSSNSDLFISSDLRTGQIVLTHSYVRSVDLNQFQFASFVSQQVLPRLYAGPLFRKWFTPQRCHEDFLKTKRDGLVLRAAWCANAQREFPGLYDVIVVAVAQDRGSETLVSRLNLQAVDYERGIAIAKSFLENLQ